MPTISACDLFRRCVHRRASVDWQEFLHRYEWRVRGAIRRAFDLRGTCLRESDLEELVQELICRLLGGTGRSRFRGRTDVHLWAYLGKVAHSLALDRRRAARTCKRRAQVISYHELLEDLAGKLASNEPSPERRILDDERWRLFLAHCHKLLNGDRATKVRALRLALREGWSSREIARRLGGALTPGQIDGLIYRLTRRLAAEGRPVPRRQGGWRAQRRGAAAESAPGSSAKPARSTS